ncbi:unnamed protein product [Effrenium voratum]|uniref:Ion transport domain-containing protein n=1 Tax=Effrenium voratum TaxID=2562239 RepID=A0AA36IQE7_9DINO|nr:unnamed protein product [Effrenium voratum]CAJ1416554.1 unnamed protein product [Effrenium voratum]
MPAMLPYGQMEELLKATQEEFRNLLALAEEQRLIWAAEVMQASQRLTAMQGDNFSEDGSCTESTVGRDDTLRTMSPTRKPNLMAAAGVEPRPEPDAKSESEPAREALATRARSNERPARAMAVPSKDSARAAPKYPERSEPVVRSERVERPERVERLERVERPESMERPERVELAPSGRKEEKKPSKEKDDDVHSRDSHISKADSDAASVQSGSSAGSDASDASGVSNGTDTSEVSQTGKKRKKSRGGQKTKRDSKDTMGFLLDDEKPPKPSNNTWESVVAKGTKYMDHVAGALVLMNSISMMLQLEMEGRTIAAKLGVLEAENFSEALPVFAVIDAIFVWIFLAELLIRLCVERRRFPMDIANWLDTVLVAGGLVDLLLSMGGEGQQDMVTLRFVSALKAFRAIRMVRSFRFSPGLRMLVKACQCCLPSLCWSMLLLAVFMCMGALIMGNLLQDFIKDETQAFEDREWVWMHYGTTYRALYTLYEITFAGNWPTNARPVLNKVSQTFVIFYLLYVTIIVFAVIRVISAIFLKDTLDEANNDAQQLVLDRLRKKAEYVARLENIFHSIDSTGEGVLTEARLTEILANAKVKAYFQTLELDVQEGAALFHLLDTGDGEVTLEEFISGIMRCKGPAKAIDTFALQRDLGKLDSKVAKLVRHMEDPTALLSAVKGPRLSHQAIRARRSVTNTAESSTPLPGGSGTPELAVVNRKKCRQQSV